MASAPRSSLVTFVGFLLAACGSGASDGAPPGPVDAARSTLAAAPTSAVADGVATVTLSATARDAGGVPLGDRLATFTVSGSDNLLSVASATTDAAGAASVALTSTRAEDKVVSVVVDGVAVAQQAAVTFEAGPAASLALSGASGQVTAGTVATVGVAARDAYGNLAKGYRGTVHFASTDAQAVLPAAIAFEASDAGQRIVQVELRTAGAQVVTATDQADPAVTGLASAAVAPAAAAALAFAVQPSGGVAGEVFTPAVRVALFDAYGNLATSGTEELGLTLSGGAAGAILTGGGATATVNGEADFPGLWVDKAAAGYQLAATSVGLAATTSVAFAITAAAPDATASTVSTAQASVPAGEATAVTASLRDLFANPAPGVAVTFAATGEGNTIMQPSAATDAAGVAIGSLTSTRAEAKTLSAVAGAVALAAQPVVNFYASAVSPADSTVVASPTPVVADGSTPVTVTVTVVDAYGNPMPGWSLQFATSRPAMDVLSSTSGDTDPNGVAIFTVTSATAGTSTLSVRYAWDFDTLPQTAQLTFVAGPVSATASTVVPSPSTVLADGITPSTITVILRDATANPVSGKVVTLASSRGAADAIAPSSGISDGGGAVTFEVRSSTFGSSTFSATDDTDGLALLATAQVDFRSYLVFATQPADAVSGALLDPAPVVAAQDAAGNTDAAFAADVTLALGTNPVSGTLTGTLTVPAGAGVATFPDLQIDKAGAGYTLVATSPAGAMAAATSSPFAVVAGSPARLVFTLQPSDSGAGIEPMLQVAIHDAAGNLTAVTGLPVSVALDANPSGATLDGTLTSPSFDGVATFSGLGVSAPGQGYTLVATAAADGLVPATSQPFDVTPPTVVGLGTPASCTEAALNAALAVGGRVTFDCGPDPVTITLTGQKTPALSAGLDGDGLVTLSGGGTTRLFGVDPGVTLALARLTVRDGRTGGNGAGILSSGTLSLVEVTMSGNATSASGDTFGSPANGGAIFNAGGTVLVDRSTFANNTVHSSHCYYGTSANGGAIYSGGGTVLVANSTFADNTASASDAYYGTAGNGGAIFNSLGRLWIVGSTLAGNAVSSAYNFYGTGGQGGAIFGGGTLANTLLARGASGANCAGTFTDGGHDLDSDGSCGVGPATDPRLDPAGLNDHGGPTRTIALQAGSPAIDAGDGTRCAAPPVLGVDQRGYARPGTGATTCSIGAFEADSTGPL